jgi:hypothetical protein
MSRVQQKKRRNLNFPPVSTVMYVDIEPGPGRIWGRSKQQLIQFSLSLSLLAYKHKKVS